MIMSGPLGYCFFFNFSFQSTYYEPKLDQPKFHFYYLCLMKVIEEKTEGIVSTLPLNIGRTEEILVLNLEIIVLIYPPIVREKQFYQFSHTSKELLSSNFYTPVGSYSVIFFSHLVFHLDPMSSK